MPSISFKIATPIIIAGLFIIVSFVALTYSSLSWMFYIVFGLLVIYVFLFGFATGQSFAKPVRNLLKKADDLSKGDLKSRFYLESKDELGQLANVFNRIADQLEESNSENETIKKSVGIKVEAETQGLRETINALEQKIQNRTLEMQKIGMDLQKFKEASAAREVESQELKSELAELKEKIGKPAPRRKKIAKVEESTVDTGSETQENKPQPPPDAIL